MCHESASRYVPWPGLHHKSACYLKPFIFVALVAVVSVVAALAVTVAVVAVVYVEVS